MFDLENLQFAARSAGKRKDLFDHLRSALGAGFGQVEHLPDLRVGQLVPQQLRHDQDRGQHVVQVVSNPAGQRPDAFHPLGAKKFRLNPFLLGDVRVDHQN